MLILFSCRTLYRAIVAGIVSDSVREWFDRPPIFGKGGVIRLVLLLFWLVVVWVFEITCLRAGRRNWVGKEELDGLVGLGLELGGNG